MKKQKLLFIIFIAIFALSSLAGCISAMVNADSSGGESSVSEAEAESSDEDEETDESEISDDTDGADDEDSSDDEEETYSDTSEADPVDAATIEFKAKDTYTDYTEDDYVEIALSDSGMTSGSGYTVSGTTVTITAEGTYVLSGTLSDGQIIVSATKDDDVRLVFSNVNITCSYSAPIYVTKADKVIISLPDGTESTVTDGTSSVNEDGDELTAAIYSKDTLTINGSGTLHVNANCNDGIATKNTLKITGGTINITAADDGIVAKDRILVRDGTVNIDCEGDGIKTTGDEVGYGYFYMEGGTLTIRAQNDGIQAESSMLICGGTLDIKTGGGYSSSGSSSGFNMMNPDATDSSSDSESLKGLKASGYIDITGGTITLNTYDDCIHSNDTIRISGGTIDAASGDDGIHADSCLEISDGTIGITKSYEGLEAQQITISGGDISIVASDDGLNAGGGSDSSSLGGRAGQNNFSSSTSCSITISGGTLEVDASGDGLDSNGTMTISGGTILVNGPSSSGDCSIDSESSYLINGGELIAIGSSGMLESPSSSSSQNCIVLTCSTYSEGSVVSVEDEDGNTIISITATKSFSSIIFSSAQVEIDSSYSFYVDDELVSTITASSTVTSSGSSSSSGRGGMGGMR